jgi:HTH-type transcriptional regulator/antitoxin HigA
VNRPWQSLPDDLHEYALRPVAVELAVEDLLPRPEIQLALGNCHDDFSAHDLPLQKEGDNMATKTRFGLKGKGHDSYLKLVLAFPLASIKSEEHLDEAQEVMDRLVAKGQLDDGEETYLDVLSNLVAAYEDKHHAIEPASDADMLRHLLEAKGITQAQLNRDTLIPKSMISEVLAGKRPFSRQMIRKLADYFKVDVSVLAANIVGLSK